MKTSHKFTKWANFVPLSLKEWLRVLLLMISAALVNGYTSLAITNFNSSEVELACHGSFDGYTTSISIDVYEGRFLCLQHTSNNWCRKTSIKGCSMDCLASADLLTFPFLVKLNGRCDERIVVRCLISSAASETILDLEESMILTAQSDPPELSVNDDQPVEASNDQVQIVCMTRNKCNKTKLEIYVKVPMQQISTTHNLEGSRFTTTTVTKAIFYEPGTYTITCKETGKDVQYSTNYTLPVYPAAGTDTTKSLKFHAPKVSDPDPKNVTDDSKNGGVNRTILLILSILSSVLGLACVTCVTLCTAED